MFRGSREPITRIKAVRLLVELDEPDGSTTTYVVNGALKENGGPMIITPEYGLAGGLPASVSVKMDCLLLPIAGESQAEFPLHRIDTTEPPQRAIEPVVLAETPRMLGHNDFNG
jgi:hypothetical protein